MGGQCKITQYICKNLSDCWLVFVENYRLFGSS